jgi:hypothetical protein
LLFPQIGCRRHKTREKLKGEELFLPKKYSFPLFFEKIYSKWLDMRKFVFMLASNRFTNKISPKMPKKYKK